MQNDITPSDRTNVWAQLLNENEIVQSNIFGFIVPLGPDVPEEMRMLKRSDSRPDQEEKDTVTGTVWSDHC